MFNTIPAIELFYLFLSLVIGIVIHELMHGVTAYWLGDDTAQQAGRLTLNPLASVDIVTTIILPFVLYVWQGFLFLAAKPVPFNPDRVKWDEYGAALVGLAGPATNLVLALLGAGLYHLTGADTGLHVFATYFVTINIGIMVFNMIPIPPLDGSRVLYAFAPEPLQRVMAQIEAMGFIFLLVILFLLFPFISPILNEVRQTILQFLL